MNVGRLRQFHTAFACGFGSLVMGLLNTWPSYTTDLYLSDQTPLSAPITKSEEALLGSLPSLGAMIGCGIIGTMMNRLGRRNAGVVVYLPFVLSWAIVSISSTINLVLAARFLGGISGGASLVLAPVFISEVVEDNIRGLLNAAPVCLYCGGTFLSYLIGWCLTYRSIIWFNLFVSIAITILLMLVTESPLYLLNQKREEDAIQSIAKYRGEPVSSMVVLDELVKLKQQIAPSAVEMTLITASDIKADEAEKEKLNIKDGGEYQKPETMSSIKMLFCQPNSRRAFVIVMTIITLQVCMGLVSVQVYAKTVFKQSDPTKADLYTIIFAIVMFSGSGLCAVVTDKTGRRFLIITSTVLVFVEMMALGYLVQSKTGPAIVTVVLIFSYCFSFMLGAGSIPYVLLAEVFIPEVQNLASTIIIEWVWFLNFLIIAIFPFMTDMFGIYGCFYFFGVMALANCVISYIIVPETKGLSHSQIQDLLNPRKKY